MAHSEYVRIVPGADRAVMFIHGIAGTAHHFTQLLPLADLVPENCSVYNVLLPGHGGSAEDFGKSSMKQWKAHVWKVFHMLSESHEQVVIAGHSMGTLFALQLAMEFPKKIPSLFLLAVPLRPYMGLRAMNNCLRLALGKLRPNKPAEVAMGIACGCAPTWKLWRYIGWIPRFLELLLEVRKTEKSLPECRVPCVVFQSRHDELVGRSAADVLKGSGIEDVRILPDSGHFYYAPSDAAALCEEFETQMKKKA